MKLYDIGAELYALDSMMEEEQDSQALKDTLEAVQGEAEAKLENIAKIIKNYEADVEALKKEEARLKARRTTLDNNIKWLKFEVLSFMQAHNIPKVKGEVLTVSVANNGGKLPVVLDIPVEELPDELCKITREANNTAIAEAIDNGVVGIAHYGERGQHLGIR